MNTTQSRNTLNTIAETARQIRDELAAKTDSISQSWAWSDAHKAQLITEARTAAAARLASLRGTAADLAADLDAYRPRASVTDAELSRAADRVTRLLDSGRDLADVLVLAEKSRDAAMVEAVREIAPTHLVMSGHGDDAANNVAMVEAHADVAMARIMSGTDQGRQAADGLLGRREARITRAELDAAQAALDGRTNALGQAIEAQYARAERDALAAQLAKPTA